MPELTKSEINLIKLLYEDRSMKDCAGVLEVSAQTVAVHKFNIRKKLKVFTDIGIMKKAIEMGIVPPIVPPISSI